MDFRQKWLLREAFKRVPRLGRSWRYVPLHRLPTGTKVRVETKETPVRLTPEGKIEKMTEEDKPELYLPTDFTFEIGIWPCIFLDYDQNRWMLKPLSDLLAPTSLLRANVYTFAKNILVHSYEIQRIEIIGSEYILHESDTQERRPKWERI